MYTNLRKLLLRTDFLQQILLASIIFTIPSNLFKTFLELSAFVKGMRIDYLIPKLHLSDLFLILFVATIFLSKKRRTLIYHSLEKTKNKILLLLLLSVLILLQLTTIHWVSATLFTFRVAILTIISTFLIASTNNTTNYNLFKTKIVQTSIKITVLFQSLLAWYQYVQQKSLFGYYFLGESNLNSYAGIAQSTTSGVLKIIPYGTTAHPNILGGILSILCIFLINLYVNSKKKKNNMSKFQRIDFFIILITISAILLTHSATAILGLTVGIGYVFAFQKRKVTTSSKLPALQNPSLFLRIFILICLISALVIHNMPTKLISQNSSFSRREYLNTAALKMFFYNPLTGVGLQNFTVHLEKYSTNQEVVRFVQPVHNIVLLLLAETGVLGILIFAILAFPDFFAHFKKKDQSSIKNTIIIKHPEYLLVLLPIAAMDHYLLTVQSGLLLLFISIVLAVSTLW